VQEVFCDPASLTSIELARVLLAERGLKPEFKTLPDYDFSRLPDYTLLIGDRALDLLLGSHVHEIWDLGAAWYELTKLPFVYAVWALRRGIENSALRRHLRDARDFGLDTLESIVRSRTDYDTGFMRDYLSWHIHFHLGTDEKRGVLKFIELLRKHRPGPVYEPKYVV
jgi:chorismate dehydratase